MLLVDLAIQKVRLAVLKHGKKPLADAVGLRESNLRTVERPDWNPTAATLRELERATAIKGVPEDVQ